MLGYAGWYSRMPYREILFYIPFQQVLWLPPLLLFYTKSLLDKSFSFSKKDAWHFLPTLVYLLYAITIAIVDKIILGYPYFYSDGRDKDFAPWYQMAGFISLFAYLLWSLQVYRRYRGITYQLTSFADSITFRWMRYFFIALLVLLVLRGAFFIINPEWAAFGRKFWYYLSFSVLFYYISISGYLNSVQTAISLKTDVPQLQPGTENPAPSPDLETQGSSLPDWEDWRLKINILMEDQKMFEIPTLTLSDVANRLNAPARKVSQMINHGFGMNFNDFINSYRTKEVIRKFEAGEHTLQTLLGIALDCGFNSKSTFIRAFKKHTSLTPKEFLGKYKQK